MLTTRTGHVRRKRAGGAGGKGFKYDVEKQRKMTEQERAKTEPRLCRQTTRSETGFLVRGRLVGLLASVDSRHRPLHDSVVHTRMMASPESAGSGDTVGMPSEPFMLPAPDSDSESEVGDAPRGLMMRYAERIFEDGAGGAMSDRGTDVASSSMGASGNAQQVRHPFPPKLCLAPLAQLLYPCPDLEGVPVEAPSPTKSRTSTQVAVESEGVFHTSKQSGLLGLSFASQVKAGDRPLVVKALSSIADRDERWEAQLRAYFNLDPEDRKRWRTATLGAIGSEADAARVQLSRSADIRALNLQGQAQRAAAELELRVLSRVVDTFLVRGLAERYLESDVVEQVRRHQGRQGPFPEQLRRLSAICS